MTTNLSISCLGSKSFDTAQQESLGFVVSYADTRILLDCGPYIARGLVSQSLKASEIDLVFISHSHVDHCGGLPWLLNTIMFEKYYGMISAPKRLKVISPTWIESHPLYLYIKSIFSWMVDVGPKSEVEFIFGAVSDLRFEQLKLSSFRLSHAIENSGIEVSVGNRKLVYIPDTDLKNISEWENRLSNADLVIFAVAGSSGDEKMASTYGFTTTKKAAAVCKRAGVRHVWFFHIYDDANSELARLEAFQTLGNDNATFAKSGDTFSLQISL